MERLGKKRRRPAVRRKIHISPSESHNLSESTQVEEGTLPAEQFHVANILLSLNPEPPSTVTSATSSKKRTYDDAFGGKCDKDTQTPSISMTLKDSLALKVDNYQLKRKVEDLQNEITRKRDEHHFSIESIEDDDEKMNFYTGLTYMQFMCLWRFLGPATRNLSRLSNPRKNETTPTKSKGPKRKLSPKNELFLTLIRMRLGLLNKDLAFRFNIAATTVNDIVTTWVQFMYRQFNKLRGPIFASRKKTKKTFTKEF
ncbi:uncharacterized protein LOC125660063 [Ostrea edulis]|uniref:uncharacterized protein LOC125660063 n=1 Tax=Ostrea edulis TaxID=37623 RepID=UPI0024AEE3F6|nr:uncharacterized protein LOC125660063 [Ostrea edulis]